MIHILVLKFVVVVVVVTYFDFEVGLTRPVCQPHGVSVSSGTKSVGLVAPWGSSVLNECPCRPASQGELDVGQSICFFFFMIQKY